MIAIGTNGGINITKDDIKNAYYGSSNNLILLEDAPHDAKPLWYLGECIKIMADADVVYFCKDWHKYRGCAIEHECAVRYGKKDYLCINSERGSNYV